jgi:predicted nucleotidyltransferase
MSAASDPILTGVVRRLVEAYSPERIYLFGSVARGEVGPDSDYDIMVIVPDDAPPERLRSRLGYRALRGTGTAADVVVWSRSGFERRARVAASLPAIVAREGMLLYSADPELVAETRA